MCEVIVIDKGDKMTYICIQAKEGSIGNVTADDADITTHENKM